ncbi:MAG: hypothetical protein QXR87_04215 [Candidatus Hadarchaeales archaeon]
MLFVCPKCGREHWVPSPDSTVLCECGEEIDILTAILDGGEEE